MDGNKNRLRKFTVFLTLCVIAAVTCNLWMPLPARFLLVKDTIRKADAIVILTGDWNYDREAKAIGLYKEGFSEKIIRILEKENRGFAIVMKALGSDITQREAYIRYFETHGVPGDSVILGETVATSTFDELKAVRDVVLANDLRSIILVTSDYHMRRTLMTAKWLFRSRGIRIYTATANSRGFNPNRWWLDEEGLKGVIFEYLSVCLYVCYHFITGK